MTKSSVRIFAPATVANVAVGFDILGFAVNEVGDYVTVSRSEKNGVTIEPVSGISEAAAIPLDPTKNTAGFPLVKMLEQVKPSFGLSVRIEKGIPLGSGMGGSAASAVGSVVAANHLLMKEGAMKAPFTNEELIQFALEGEALASGAKHADNIAPCLYGGLTLSHPGADPKVVSLPYPEDIFCVLVRPEFRLDTKIARAALKLDLSLKTHIQQSVRLALLISGLHTGNLEHLRAGLDDVLVEPQRAPLIPGFDAVKKAAMKTGVLGCSISGAGPTVFAIATTLTQANLAKEVMIAAFESHGNLSAQGWISSIRKQGAGLV